MNARDRENIKDLLWSFDGMNHYLENLRLLEMGNAQLLEIQQGDAERRTLEDFLGRTLFFLCIEENLLRANGILLSLLYDAKRFLGIRETSRLWGYVVKDISLEGYGVYQSMKIYKDMWE